ncbi:hypothetical protein Bca52824_075927 [Brassica carinata]|uniref:GTD-binding domain-containing protein n=1 Tax=Brassica carinata TaxID=52824 RepID=A0A8X7PSY3_BRACI|nr:hypothetical protein Bca52824_075927 [Brassica carinata]
MLERNESTLSLEGVSVSEIEGESEVERLKRQVDHDRKFLTGLYKELEEERSASAVATNQAMAMITRLQEEKATFQMEALQNLRMMEEQAQYDLEAIQKLNELLVEREKVIQDLEAEIDYFRGLENKKIQNCLTGFDEEGLYITSCLEKIENMVQEDVNGEALVDNLVTQESVTELRERVEKLKGCFDLLEHVVNSLGYGSEAPDEVDVETLIRNEDKRLLYAMTVSTRLVFRDVLLHTNAAERAMDEEISLMEDPTKIPCDGEFQRWKSRYEVEITRCLSDALSLGAEIESPTTQYQEANAAQHKLLIQSRGTGLKQENTEDHMIFLYTTSRQRSLPKGGGSGSRKQPSQLSTVVNEPSLPPTNTYRSPESLGAAASRPLRQGYTTSKLKTAGVPVHRGVPAYWRARIDMERTRREFLCSSSLALKMLSNFDATNEGESVAYEEEKVKLESRNSFTFKERFTAESNVERRSN